MIEYVTQEKKSSFKKKKAQKADPDTEQLRYLQSLNVWKRKVDSFARGNYRIHAVLYYTDALFALTHFSEQRTQNTNIQINTHF